jgi:two-component system, NarL family, nitrate/nitrite response regulator NarL
MVGLAVSFQGTRMTITIAIVDDHPLTRRGIRSTLEDEPGFAIVAEGASADEAVDLARQHRPDVMFLDIDMPGGGINAVKAVKAELPDCKVVMLTIYDNLANVQASLEAGASAYVLKGVEGDELISVVKHVLADRKFVSPDLAARLVMEVPVAAAVNHPSADNQLPSDLNKREAAILGLIKLGKGNREIAEQLGLSEATIKQYASVLFRKIGVKNRTEAAIKAI